MTVFLYQKTNVLPSSIVFSYFCYRYEHLASLLAQMLEKRPNDALSKLDKLFIYFVNFYDLININVLLLSTKIRNVIIFCHRFVSEILENASREGKKAKFKPCPDSLKVMNCFILCANVHVLKTNTV